MTQGNPKNLRLLGIGYLPKELPSCFTTVELSTYVKLTGYKGLTRGGRALVQINKTSKTRVISETALSLYSYARAGGVKRILAVPNPMTHSPLTECMELHWLEISKRLTSSLSSSLLIVDHGTW